MNRWELYDPAVRAAAVEVYVAHGLGPAMAWSGASPGSVVKWVQRTEGVVLHGQGRRSLPRPGELGGCGCPACSEPPPMAARAVPAELAGVRAAMAEAWRELANCVGVDPDLFFPERGASTMEAKATCRPCVVRDECLEFALTNGEKFGVWGGMSERERRRLRRERAKGRRS